MFGLSDIEKGSMLHIFSSVVQTQTLVKSWYPMLSCWNLECKVCDLSSLVGILKVVLRYMFNSNICRALNSMLILAPLDMAKKIYQFYFLLHEKRTLT